MMMEVSEGGERERKRETMSDVKVGLPHHQSKVRLVK